MTILPKKYSGWEKLWFYEYILNKKSLRDLSKEFNIPAQTLDHIFKVRGLPLRNLKTAQKIRRRRIKENANK